MAPSKTRNGKTKATAGNNSSIKRLLADHLADAHEVWLTTLEYKRLHLHDIAKLDPCKMTLVA